ncbi:MAG TPA: hypothetical protein PLS49_02305 [Candidatus Woesebacteria bacterium]|nr:hypothetical protein [Candidatus Woesebacteria bacterium]
MAGGVYESATFNGGFTRAFNRMLTSYSQPANTIINFQIAIADSINGSCTGVTYNFVGPDGTANTYFTTDSPIPFNDDGTGFENPSQCMRYRAYLSTTDYNTTPVFEDIIINYSP